MLNWIRNMGKSDSFDESCIFCLIAGGQDQETEVLMKNDDMVCFRDINPAAPHHYLVIPRRHIPSCLSLHRGDDSLIGRMAEMGRAVLRDQGITDTKDIRLGFHQPPYISVHHLHLHVLAPSSQISQCMLFKFTPGTDSFITDECMLKCLKKRTEREQERCRYQRTRVSTWSLCGCEGWLPCNTIMSPKQTSEQHCMEEKHRTDYGNT